MSIETVHNKTTLKCNITLFIEPPEMSSHFVAQNSIILLFDIDIPPPPFQLF